MRRVFYTRRDAEGSLGVWDAGLMDAPLLLEHLGQRVVLWFFSALSPSVSLSCTRPGLER